jgi:hypothetical protein
MPASTGHGRPAPSGTSTAQRHDVPSALRPMPHAAQSCQEAGSSSNRYCRSSARGNSLNRARDCDTLTRNRYRRREQ